MTTNEQSSPSASSASSAPVGPDQQVTLQVGERRLVTMTRTLTQESGFFAAFFSHSWNKTQPDGSYFVDADGDLFEHILRYLRRGVLPVFYDKSKGHDYARYLALGEEVRYFQITRLEKWIRDGIYLQAVHVRHSAWELDDVSGLSSVLTADTAREYHPAHWTRKVYVCPRGLYQHRGDPDRCGKACRKAQGDAEDEYVDEFVRKILVVERKTTFDRDRCLEGQ